MNHASQIVQDRVRSSALISAMLFQLASVLLSPSAGAADMFWSNTRGDGSGTFSSATNWSPSVPGASDVAHFGLTTSGSVFPATYTVAFTSGATNQRLIVEDDHVTFALNGNVYQTPGAFIGGLVVGRSASLTILNGSWDNNSTSGTIFLGGASASGALTVSTGGAVLNQRIDVGGTLTVQNGGRVVSPFLVINGGAATVTGPNSRLTLEALEIGAQSGGTLNINAGGQLQTSGGVLFAESDGVGTVNIDGLNSSWTHVGTGFIEFGRFGQAIVNVTGGGQALLGDALIGPRTEGSAKVAVSGVGSQFASSGLTIGFNGNGELDVSAGGLARSTGPVFSVGHSAEGKVNVDSGGRIEAVNSTLGSFGGIGIGAISGAGSEWISTGDLKVGDFNQGTLSISDGALVQNVNGFVGARALPLVAIPGSVVTVSGAGTEWQNFGTLTVGESWKGTLNIAAGGVVRSSNGVVGSLARSVGAVTIDGFSSKWISSADIRIGLDGGGAVTVTNEGALQAQNVFVESHGSLGGNGRVVGDVQNNGIVSPGASIGTLEVNGAFTQQPGGVLEIEIGGPSGSQVDLLKVGAATLDGELRLKLIGATIPAVNVALTSAGLAGQFDNVASGQRLFTVDGGGSFVVHYGPGSPFNPNQVVLSSFVPGVNGDFDHDGDVDGRDFLLWQRGGSPTPLSTTDLAAWKTNFGAGGLAATSAAVPEPGSALACVMALCGLWTLPARRAESPSAANPP